jgi:serine/threonine protein kinase
MDSARWEQIQTLFHEVADLSPPEQRTLLNAACGDDQELVAEVLALAEEDARGTSLLDRDLAHVAEQVLDEGMPRTVPFKQFGPYRIKQALGEGGMGVVYLAERTDLGSLVAIKILRDAWLSPARRERFASEQRTLAQLNHASIARLYDADTLDDGTPWFVMEYVEGVPLTDYCSQHACSIEQRLQLFRSVCEAVQYAHQHAVIHRDLKPSNILVKPDGTVRLLDFGIAKQLESLDTPAGHNQTMTGLRLMTPAYAAPEQVRGQRLGVQTDVYSLGVILYELLAGELPFDLSQLTPAEAEAVIVGQDPEKPSAVTNRAAPDHNHASPSKTAWTDLDVLCITAMHKETERRYQSVEALIRDLDHYLKGEPLEARPDTFRYRLGKFVRRNRRAVSAAALGFTVIVGLVAFFTVRLAKARNVALEEAARTERIQRFMMNLFEGGDEAAGPADSLRVVSLLDQGVQKAQTLNNDPKVQAELYQNLGSIYQKLGKFDPADSLLRRALEQRKSLFGRDSSEVAESLVTLGLLRADQAKYDEAEQLVRQGLEMSRRHLPPNHPAVARDTYALGKVLGQHGSYDQAIPVLGEAVRLQSAPGASTTDLADSLSALADTQCSAGHYDICDPVHRRVLEMHRRLYGPRHPVVADDLASLGAVQTDLGYYDKAEQFYRQALDITESYYGKDHPKTAARLTGLGEALGYESKFDEADGALQQALTIQEHVYGPVHPAVAEALNELGNVASMRNHLDEAEARFRRAADIYRAVYGDHHYQVAIALSNVASLYYDRKNYPRAEQLFRDVVRRFTEALSADNVNTAIARLKLGRTLLHQNRYREAEVETSASYEILTRQTSPATSFVRAARKDLAAEYDGLRQPEKAAKYRAELGAAENKTLEASKK